MYLINLLEFKVTYNLKVLKVVDVTVLQPGVIKIPGDFGTITYDGVVFQTYAIYVSSPSWHGLMNQRYAMELQLKAREYYGKSITIVVLFETDPQDAGFNGFLYNLGLGSGEIAKMQPGDNQIIEGQEHPDIS